MNQEGGFGRLFFAKAAAAESANAGLCDATIPAPQELTP
jgi:hypothetical protein